MYCIHCGKELPENSKFCNHCGGLQQTETVNISQTYNDVESNKTFRSTRQMREANKVKNKNKGCTTVCSFVAIVLGILMIIGIFAGDSEPSESGDTNKSTTEVSTNPPIEISASKLVQAYIDNEVKADMTYDDKTVVITGYVDRIGQTDSEFSESKPVVYVGTGDSIESCLRCYLSTEQKALVAELEQGDKITLTGRCVGLGSAYFNLKCVNIYDSVISE